MTAAVLGKYALIRKIAQGGMGDVYLARQVEGIDRLVILKSLRTESAQEPDFVEQFLDEARVAATLNHPNIVSIYDVGEWEGTFWIVMEYIQGEDLSRLWYAAAKAGVGLPFQVTVRIIHDAAMGLDHAHQAGDVEGRHLQIVHRDVSPQNIMVRADGVTKVVDFGIAKAKNRVSSTQAGLVKGKLQYMSPEQVRGEPLDGKSDQFSLGVCLWEMATGKRLFKAASELDTLNKILTHAIPRPSSIVRAFPASLEETVMRMLERDRKRRFTTCKDVAHALQAYLDKAPTHKRVRVSDFVDSVVGEQLRQRVADLTPMRVRPSRIPAPTERQTRPPGLAEPKSVPRDATIPDGAPMTDPGDAPIRVLRRGGEVVSLADFDEVRKEIFFGHLGPEDEIAVGDTLPVALGAHHALSHLFDESGEPATQALSNSTIPQVDAATAAGPALGESETGAWSPGLVPAGSPSDEGAALADAFNDPTAAMSLLEEDFVIGENAAQGLSGDEDALGPTMLMHAEQTGHRAVAPERIERGPSGPTYDEYDVADDLDAAFGKKRSAWGLIAAAALMLLIGVPLALYLFAPSTFHRYAALVLPGAGNTADAKALRSASIVLLRDDDADRLGPRLAELSAADAPASLAERAMLTAALSRIHAERVRLGLDATSAASAEAEAAYTLASKARAEGNDMAWAHMAAAHAHLAAGAQIELESDIEQAMKSVEPSDVEAVKAEGLRLVALAAADRALAGDDAAARKTAAAVLADIDGDDRRIGYARAALAAAATPPDRNAALALLREVPHHALAAHLAGKPNAPSPSDSVVNAPASDAPASDTPASDTPPTDAPAVAAQPAPQTGVPPAKPAPSSDASPAIPTFAKSFAAAERQRRRGRNRSAIKLYKQAIALNKDARAYRGLGWAYLDSEETAAAIRNFKTAARINPSDAQSYLGLAESYRFAARTEDARAAYKKVLTKNPDREDRVTAENALRSLR